jgi:phosphatidylserine/phosphatidylglycerophosphate/cardiolipin synthase-like enzyme
MEILKTPWKNDFLELVSQSKKSIKITSPFVKKDICDEMLNAKNSSSKIDLITSFKLMSIHAGSLDISAIENILNVNGSVKNYPKLHSKIYLFDDKKAIITSGNLTHGGMVRNFEYGIYIDEIKVVQKIIADFDSISNNELTGKVEKRDIDLVKKILSKIPKTTKPKFPSFEIESPEENFDIIENSTNEIQSTLKGWKSDIFKYADSINNQIFSLSEIYQFESLLKEKYPNNTRITDKIRQQLQFLRNLGLIEFLGNGMYKKLWK